MYSVSNHMNNDGWRSILLRIKQIDQKWSKFLQSLILPREMEYAIALPSLLFGRHCIPFLIFLSFMFLPLSIACYFGLACLCTVILTEPLKYLFNRERPRKQSIADRAVAIRDDVTNPAFPSGDSAQAAVAAGVLYYITKQPFFLLLPIPTMFGRVYYGAHWIGDTIGGVAIGLLVSMEITPNLLHILEITLGEFLPVKVFHCVVCCEYCRVYLKWDCCIIASNIEEIAFSMQANSINVIKRRKKSIKSRWLYWSCKWLLLIVTACVTFAFYFNYRSYSFKVHMGAAVVKMPNNTIVGFERAETYNKVKELSESEAIYTSLQPDESSRIDDEMIQNTNAPQPTVSSLFKEFEKQLSNLQPKSVPKEVQPIVPTVQPTIHVATVLPPKPAVTTAPSANYKAIQQQIMQKQQQYQLLYSRQNLELTTLDGTIQSSLVGNAQFQAMPFQQQQMYVNQIRQNAMNTIVMKYSGYLQALQREVAQLKSLLATTSVLQPSRFPEQAQQAQQTQHHQHQQGQYAEDVQNQPTQSIQSAQQTQQTQPSQSPNTKSVAPVVYRESVYYYPFDNYTMYPKPYIFPLRALSQKNSMKEPVGDKGIVYYVYANSKLGCDENNKFIKELEIYATRGKKMTPEVKIAVVTNCHVSKRLFKTIDILIPIHPADLILTTSQVQFTTRMIYNRFPPFRISLVMDAHTCWCSNGDATEVFDLFEKSDVDLAFSTRVLNRWTTSGFAVMYRYNERTYKYWTSIMDDNMATGFHSDDQYPMRLFADKMMRENELKFRWLSNNWFYAPHSVSEEGEFVGDANCYRSSVLINGRVRFIHGGGQAECILANGPEEMHASRLRTHFTPKSCTFDNNESGQLVFSQKEMERLVLPHKAPNFNWTLLDHENPDALFWYADKKFTA